MIFWYRQSDKQAFEATSTSLMKGWFLLRGGDGVTSSKHSHLEALLRLVESREWDVKGKKYPHDLLCSWL